MQQVVYRTDVRRKRGQWRVSVPALPGDAPVIVTRQLGNAAPLLIEALAEYLGVSNALVEVVVEQPRRAVRRSLAQRVTATVVQVWGGLGALAGVYLLAGVAATLITAGIAVATLATLRESGRI